MVEPAVDGDALPGPELAQHGYLFFQAFAPSGEVVPQGLVLDTTRVLSGYPAGATLPAVPAEMLSATRWVTAATADLTAWAGPWGVAFAANLTPDSSGLGAWTDAAFIATMRSGRHLGIGRALLPAMPWWGLAGLTDDDLKALFAYLRTMKPVRNLVPPPLPLTGAQ